MDDGGVVTPLGVVKDSKMSGESVNYKRGGTLFIEMSALERKRGKTGV